MVKKIPGSGADRAVFVDRIPAEMVDRIQIIRSQVLTKTVKVLVVLLTLF